MKPDAGESVRTINSRQDREAWEVVESALRDGATLCFHLKIRRAAVEGLPPDDRRNGRTISGNLLSQLQARNVVREVALNRYVLTNKE